MKCYAALAIAIPLAGSSAVCKSQALPEYMAPISSKTSAKSADIATRDMLALNTGMFELYGDAAKIFQKNILSKHPPVVPFGSKQWPTLITQGPGPASIADLVR